MKTLPGILFAFSMILGVAFLSAAVSTSNPFSAQAQIKRKINHSKGSWTWRKCGNEVLRPGQKCKNEILRVGAKNRLKSPGGGHIGGRRRASGKIWFRNKNRH